MGARNRADNKDIALISNKYGDFSYINMSISAQSFSAGYTGCFVISNTSANTGTFRGFVVNADAVVSACLNQASASLMTTLGLSGVTLKQGAFICVPDGTYISSITLTSGSVIAYNI